MKLSATLGALALPIIAIAGTPNESFDSREATIDGVHNAIFSGLTSCRDVVSSFISRIEAFNPTINAIITLNPNALTIADDMDAKFASGNVTGSLFCIPVLLKDNYDTEDMNTTAGCLDLAGNSPLIDALTVTAFKKAGAIILGKTNLHELALEGLSVSSLGGQTVNPYDHTRTPGGSSGGTGAAIAASFAVFGTGTDTVNSLRSPASANSLFSFRPTRGLISRAGVVPISYTQDAVGALARNVKDLAVALTVMSSVGYDPNDNATSLIPSSSVGVDYSEDVYGGTLKGLRFGLVEGFFNRTESNETTPVTTSMAEIVLLLRSAGATVVSINETVYNATAIGLLDVQTSEFREQMDKYLKMSSDGGTRPSTLNELYGSSKFLVIPSQYSFVNTALKSSTGYSTYPALRLGIQNLTTTLGTTFSANKFDAIIYPEQKNLVVKIGSPSQSGRNGILAALTGSPVLTVPIGFSPPTGDAPIGIPIGMEILGLPWSEGKLLNIASHIAGLKHVRRMPSFANGTVEVMAYASVPTILPNPRNIPSVYPIGTL
ncbi:Glutamyl-tRNA(Gln) amidotransferase subunit A 2 [Hyphodiscus hymeniophilus]|uniref:Glutamyl-tRNA(Gln) amidotransferase subunit A 2 n=1 Tax=Hyphodiscus hymeniophilus TaxID=353542 RepID=A0A9P7AYB7_9HELO|nr:Glutamyl-tRNA(Gln) amidotransferase subunit A 2 [Hyphodiscus hymeniophilus]